jgi:hypothetical protein
MIRLGFYNMWVLALERSTILRVFSRATMIQGIFVSHRDVSRFLLGRSSVSVLSLTSDN